MSIYKTIHIQYILKETQFKKGQSGNPKGRPKGDKNYLALANRELSQKFSIMENGRRKTLSKKEVFVKTTINKGIAGDKKFTNIAYTMMQDAERYNERKKHDEKEQSKINQKIIENFRKRVLEENKEVEE